MKHDLEIYGQLWPYKTTPEVPAVLLRAGRKYSEISVSRTPYTLFKGISVVRKIEKLESFKPVFFQR